MYVLYARENAEKYGQPLAVGFVCLFVCCLFLSLFIFVIIYVLFGFISSCVFYTCMSNDFSVLYNQCVVIGLQSTGEARLVEQIEDAGGELSDFVSTAK